MFSVRERSARYAEAGAVEAAHMTVAYNRINVRNRFNVRSEPDRLSFWLPMFEAAPLHR